VVLEGQLLGDALPPDLTQRLIDRLTRHGPLAEGSTPGTLTAALSVLAQRVQWAMSTDLEYPATMAKQTTYHLAVPAGAVAACIAALREAGAEEISDGPPTMHEWETRSTGPDGALERHSVYPPDGREVTAVFRELAPDPAYHERVAQLSALAGRHGGRYAGASW